MSEIFSPVATRLNPNLMNSHARLMAIKFIVIHHNATTNNEGAMRTWEVASGNGTSAHYQVTPTEIIGCVGENYTAYHAGGTHPVYDRPTIPNINDRSIGLEHLNETGAPEWRVADATLRQSAKLIADICKRYGLPIDRNTIKTHGEITKTACPGGIDINKLIRYAREAAGIKMKPESKGIRAFKDNPNYLATKPIKVDEVKSAEGIDQFVSYVAAGTSKPNWLNHGFPLAVVDKVDAYGKKTKNQLVSPGDFVILKPGFNEGTVDFIDDSTEAVGIDMSTASAPYGVVWMKADWLLKQ